MEKLLEGKACVITGGCGSIGLTTARLFLAEGARGVLLVDLDEARLVAAQESLGRDRAEICVADVSEAAGVDLYISKAVSLWERFDTLFSNAGNYGLIAPLAEYDDEAFDRTLRIHVRGGYLACKKAPAHMNDKGSIIVTSSMAGVRGGAGCEKNIAYTVAKHALTGVVRAAARAWAPRGIRVNSLNPGPVDNDFQADIEQRLSQATSLNFTKLIDNDIPLGRHASSDEVAKVALFLASSMSDFVTGHIYPVDGGLGS